VDIDGHNEELLHSAFSSFYSSATLSQMSIVFARTIKGKGIEFMENSIAHHFRCPIEDGYLIQADEI
jgi:transketolase